MADNETGDPVVMATLRDGAKALPGRKLVTRSGWIVIALAICALVVALTWPKPEAAPTQLNDNPAKAQRIQNPLVYTSDSALLTLGESEGALEALKSLLQKAEWPSPRGEFETSAEYRERVAHFDRPIGGYARTTPFVVIVPAVAQYDADAGTLTLQTSQSGSDASPSVVLESNTTDGSSYIGENAFGVKAAVTQTVTTQTILIPIASLKGPAGCDFLKGKDGQEHSAALVDGAAFTDWACGWLRYVDKSLVENVSSYKLQVDRDKAKDIATRPLKFSYVLSFDRLPVEGFPILGPMDYKITQPTITAPHKFRVTGFTMIAKLHRVVIYTERGGIIFIINYD